MPAVAPIVPQRSIRGVELGMRRAAVVRTLGHPSHVRRGTNDLGPYTELSYAGLRVVFAFDGGVSELETRSPLDRTRSGVGVGSTERQVRAAIRGLVCLTEASIRHCHLGAYRAGRVVTDVFFRRGRAWRIVVGRVLD